MPSRIFPGRPEKPDWNRVDCLERNRYPRHAYLIQFPDQTTCENALDNNRRYLSPLVLMLNGTWDYKWFESILQLPENIFAYRSGFDRTDVPSTRSVRPHLQGHCADWPFVLDPPHVPDTLPVAVYHRSVQLPRSWGMHRKKLVIQGVYSACHVVLNGKMVGYAQNGRLLHEFDVSSLMHDGSNELFILVYPYQASSYLDGHCLNNRAGISGDIYFEAVPSMSVLDLNVHTRLDALTDQWEMAVQATVQSYKVTQDLPRVRFTLAKEGQAIQEQLVEPEKSQPSDINVDLKTMQTGTASLHWKFAEQEINPWSDEQPDLYDLFVACLDASGKETSCVHQSIGFNERSIRDGRLYLNHKPVFLNLADYDPHDERTGQILSPASLARDLRLVKQHFNAILLRGGPVDPMFHELCNHLGLLVVANPAAQPIREWLESERTTKGKSWDSGAWQAVVKDRLYSQILLERTQPCVVAWSVDEALWQKNSSLSTFIRSLDPSRPLVRIIKSTDPANLAEWPMASANAAVEILDPDNRLLAGGTHRFLEPLISASEQSRWSGMVTGPWQDVRQVVRSTRERPFAAALSAVRQSGRPASIEPLDLGLGQFLIANRTRFLSLDLFRLHWQIMASGQLYIAGEIDLPSLQPGEKQLLSIPYAEADWPRDTPCILQLTVHLIEANLWCPADWIVSTDSFSISNPVSDRDPYLDKLIPVIQPGRSRLRLEQDRHLLVLSGNRFWLVFNRLTAQIESWRCKDHEFLAFAQPSISHQTSALVFWRPALDQDQAWYESWQSLGMNNLEQVVDNVSVDCDGEKAQIEVDCRYGPAGQKTWLAARLLYTIHESGKIELKLTLPCDRADAFLELPRIGFRLMLRHHYDRIVWSGQGPWPTWPDLQSLSYQGKFERTLSDLMPETGSPMQTHMPHYATAWAAVADSEGNGLLFESNQPFSFCASDYLPSMNHGQGLEKRLVHQNMIEWTVDFHFKPSGGRPAMELDRSAFAGDRDKIEYHLTLTPVSGI